MGTTRLFQGLQKTSGLCALGRKALATRAPSSIELSQNSCSREETSREAMALGASPSTETNSTTKTLHLLAKYVDVFGILVMVASEVALRFGDRDLFQSTRSHLSVVHLRANLNGDYFSKFWDYISF